MKWKEIVANAEKVKKGVEKNKAIPKISGYTTPQLCYIFAKAVRTPNKDITDKKVENCPNCTGSSIEKNLTRNEYQKLAKHTIDWIDKRGVAPNYTTYQNYMVSIRLQTYCYAKIIVFYDEHSNTLPVTCWFKNKVFYSTDSNSSNTNKSSNTSTSSCKNPYKNKGHSTEHCCEDIGQNNGYFCACHSAQEVIRKLTGKVIPQSTLASVMSTTTSGTSHNGIRTGIAWFNKKYGYNLQVEEKSFSDLGWEKIGKLICKSNVDIIFHNLYRNQWGHYEVINEVNTATKMLKVQNSLGSQCSRGCYYGYVEDRSFRTMESYMSGISQKSLLIITRK